jgi:hypothetical protein
LPVRVEDDLTSSPLPLMPEDAGPDTSLSSVGGPYRRLADDEPAEVPGG